MLIIKFVIMWNVLIMEKELLEDVSYFTSAIFLPTVLSIAITTIFNLNRTFESRYNQLQKKNRFQKTTLKNSKWDFLFVNGIKNPDGPHRNRLRILQSDIAYWEALNVSPHCPGCTMYVTHETLAFRTAIRIGYHCFESSKMCIPKKHYFNPEEH